VELNDLSVLFAAVQQAGATLGATSAYVKDAL